MFTIQRRPKGPGRFQCPPDSVSSSASPLPLIQRYSAPRAPSPSPSVRSLLFSLSLPQLSWSQLQQYKVASARREELLNRCWNRQSDDQPSSCAEGLASESRRRGGLRDQLVPLLSAVPPSLRSSAYTRRLPPLALFSQQLVVFKGRRAKKASHRV